MAISWTPDLDTGIDIIDLQHRRIVDFINDLEVAHGSKDPEKIKRLVDDCVDYTLSHFAFEESLQEDAAYQYCKAHKKTHELFSRRIFEYQERLAQGDDVAEELHGLLSRWLINHIKTDDAHYVSVVKASLGLTEIEPEPIAVSPPTSEALQQPGWVQKWFKK